MLLILSSPDDIHAQEVCKYLLPEQYYILDTSLFPQQIHLAVNYNGKYDAHFVDLVGKRILDLSKFKSFWWRRPQPYEVHKDMEQSQYYNFTYQEMEEAISGLWLNCRGRWMNIPHVDEIASKKVYQLRVAQELGFNIPNTLISNSEQSFRKFQESALGKKIIYKPFKGSEKHWRETRILRKEEENELENLKYAPVIFQNYIEALADLRITVVGDKIFAAAIYSQTSSYKIDFRMDMKGVEIEAIDLPLELETKIRALMKQLGLSYGAIDMRLTPNDEYVFLEINPAGQWLFIEFATGQPISKCISEFLSEECEHPVLAQ